MSKITTTSIPGSLQIQQRTLKLTTSFELQCMLQTPKNVEWISVHILCTLGNEKRERLSTLCIGNIECSEFTNINVTWLLIGSCVEIIMMRSYLLILWLLMRTILLLSKTINVKWCSSILKLHRRHLDWRTAKIAMGKTILSIDLNFTWKEWSSP